MSRIDFPNGINRIIEEYCFYPKKYMKELEEKTKTIYEQCSKLTEVISPDLSYCYVIAYPKIIITNFGPVDIVKIIKRIKIDLI